jgi:two-component system response regulator NreC
MKRQAQMTISILLADDHQIVLQGVRALLESEPDFRVLGEACTGIDALEKAMRLKPDVVVLDLSMPDIRGSEIARQIHKNNPKTKIIILSMYSKEAYVVEALNNGALSYVLKGSQSDELVQAIRLAVHDIRYLSPPLSEDSLQQYISKTKGQNLDLLETLTNRERQILHLAARGIGNIEIAKTLSISPRTVEVHRAKVMSKLGLHNQSELIRLAIQRGILAVDEKDTP